jgi:peptidyl-prolyl cis-trans isomerase B (cyclophilin B)
VQGQTYAPDQLNADNVKYGKMVGLLNRMFYEGKNPELLQEFIALQQAGDMEALKRKTFESLSIIEQEYGKQTFPEISSRQIEAYTKNGGALHLDGEYSVFGKVVEGLDVIDKIAAVPTDQSERPTTDIIMIITLEEITKKEIARKYGYSYSEN